MKRILVKYACVDSLQNHWSFHMVAIKPEQHSQFKQINIHPRRVAPPPKAASIRWHRIPFYKTFQVPTQVICIVLCTRNWDKNFYTLPHVLTLEYLFRVEFSSSWIMMLYKPMINFQIRQFKKVWSNKIFQNFAFNFHSWTFKANYRGSLTGRYFFSTKSLRPFGFARYLSLLPCKRTFSRADEFSGQIKTRKFRSIKMNKTNNDQS